VLYTSVYPFDFQYHPDPRGPIGALLATWRTPIYGTDLVANILFYIPLGYFCYLACGNRTRFTTAILIVAGAVVLSAGMEIVQFWEVERTSSIWDVIANTMGAALGVAAGSLVDHGLYLPLFGRVNRRPCLLLLIGCFLVYEFFPDVRTLDLTRFRFLVQSVTPVSPVELAIEIAYWLALAAMLEEVVGVPKSRLAIALLAISGAAVQVLIRPVPPAFTRVTASAAAVLAWVPISRRRLRYALLAVMLGCAVAASGLEPFRFRLEARHFQWIPFYWYIEGQPGKCVPAFFKAAFSYGGLTWLLLRSGASFPRAAAGVTAIAGGVSLGQVYLSGRPARAYGHNPGVDDGRDYGGLSVMGKER
jgi:VanZ family protein